MERERALRRFEQVNDGERTCEKFVRLRHRDRLPGLRSHRVDERLESADCRLVVVVVEVAQGPKRRIRLASRLFWMPC